MIHIFAAIAFLSGRGVDVPKDALTLFSGQTVEGEVHNLTLEIDARFYL